MAVELRDGRPVLVREGGDELRAEAARLALVAGPGVPAVLELVDDGRHVRLVTAVAPPLACGPDEAVLVCAQVAEVLARAHAAGVVHGPIHDEHVRGGPTAVVLDGWGDPSGTPADDVAEVGALLDRLGGDDPVVHALAARAGAAGRPTAAGLASALRAAAPPPRPRPPRTGDGIRGDHPEIRRRFVQTAVAGLAATAVLVTAGGIIGARNDSTGPAPAPATTTTTSTPSTTTSVPVAVAAVVTGNVVERDGVRWTVGRPGDLVVVGDWDCDGEATPAVLRPATGEVWVFRGWAADGQPTAGRTLTTVPGATSIRARPTDGGCHRLEAVDAEGQSTLLG